MITRRTALTLLASVALPSISFAEAPSLAAEVRLGTLPPLPERLPRNPRVVDLPAMGRSTGRYSGSLRMLISGQRDVRLIPIYSYARLVGYNADLRLAPDLLAGFEAEDDRIYTLHLREGHRWSDGSPFTAADFEYCWRDMMNNPELYRGGPPVDLIADGKVVAFEVIDPLTVRYTFASPMPDFLPKLAAPLPLILFAPHQYMRQFHASYQTPEKLAELVEINRVDDWQSLHAKMVRSIRPENPDLPTLEAWRPRTAPPAEQFVFERNPYYHRVDQMGQQLPYFDRIVLAVASAEIIAAKTATGESDLQANGITFPDYTLMKQAEKQHPLKVSLWRRTQGSSVSLLPNLNCNDPVWRKLFQDVRMRRALSVAINRKELNKVNFFGLGRESADTILPDSQLYKPEYASAWAQYDPDLANALLDELGLTERGGGNIRLLPDGRQAGIVVETAGESTMEVDVLELITDHMRDVGIAIYIRSTQRDVFRSRAMGGEVQMAVWQGLDNAVPTADMSPDGLAPTSADQLQWPVWGTWYASAQTAGKAPDMPEAIQLIELLHRWRASTTTPQRTRIWGEMLRLWADQVFSIGTVNAAPQPIVRAVRMRNIPNDALYGFTPTSFLGAYMPDTFYMARE
ncbi:peptide ABC transporter substrate-binding protein [Cypionkella aquatica]|uniref:Peptide ABC transporter substrate-binding protein n=1 Tax=Cypionkella aquatica TaxID=1756042 RepID=A0AA37TRS5_9RHOB|nr:ABC transporter substrate-binding protein [Cypionkella aquatica]GLS86347.1 peptide ABC transporter substrate-binding protein [Cypionkella aquatica]